MFVVFFFYKKRKKNGICTKCLLISKKYIYVATGVSPVKDCKKNKKLTKKDFFFRLMSDGAPDPVGKCTVLTHRCVQYAFNTSPQT